MERIVVGVDGSTNAEAALQWAAEESDLHGVALTAVMAWDFLEQHHADGDGTFDPSYGSGEARQALHAALQAVSPSRPIEERAVLDKPAQALLDVSADADLLVVGARGLGGFKGLLLGSVSERMLEEGPCPVAVVREDIARPDDGPIVVGIDGSSPANEALRWAAGEARVRRAPLDVVHAWQMRPPTIPASDQVMRSVEDAAREVLDTALEDESLSDVQVRGHLAPSSPTRALLQHADGASLAVVGSRGLGRLRRAVLGSTSRQLAHHAPCPVVVLPPDH